MLDSEVGPLLLGLLHSFLKDACGIVQLELGHVRQLVGVLEMRLIGLFVCVFVVDLGVYARLRLVLNPLANEKLVL